MQIVYSKNDYIECENERIWKGYHECGFILAQDLINKLSCDLPYELYVNTFIHVGSIFNERVVDNIKENIEAVTNAYNMHGYEFICLPPITDFDNVRKYA